MSLLGSLIFLAAFFGHGMVLWWTIHFNNDNVKLFDHFIRRYNRSYKIGSEEYYKRFLIFEKSIVRQNDLNHDRPPGEDEAVFGINQFSDMTPDEFSKLLQLQPPIRTRQRSSRGTWSHNGERKYIPKSVDWRKKHAVTRIKNQGACGACWAFSVVETVESMNAIQHGKLEELSVEELIDCAAVDDKCNGGDICATADWLKQQHINITTDGQYPLTDKDEKCKFMPKTGISLAEFSCSNFKTPQNPENPGLLQLVSQGPVAVAVDATLWQDYLGGIIQHHCSPDDLNHAVELVGYDLTGPIPYYIARNSWGTSFGIGGYLKIIVGKNMCGIAEEVLSLTVN